MWKRSRSEKRSQHQRGVGVKGFSEWKQWGSLCRSLSEMNHCVTLICGRGRPCQVISELKRSQWKRHVKIKALRMKGMSVWKGSPCKMWKGSTVWNTPRFESDSRMNANGVLVPVTDEWKVSQWEGFLCETDLSMKRINAWNKSVKKMESQYQLPTCKMDLSMKGIYEWKRSPRKTIPNLSNYFVENV